MYLKLIKNQPYRFDNDTQCSAEGLNWKRKIAQKICSESLSKFLQKIFQKMSKKKCLKKSVKKSFKNDLAYNFTCS